MTDIFEDFAYSWAPRVVIEDALSGRDLARSSRTWHCLACEVCEYTCPNGVRFRDFILSLRNLAQQLGYTRDVRNCRSCGAPLLPGHTLRYVRRKTKDFVPDSALLCERCKRRIIMKRFKTDSKTSKKVVSIWRRDGRKKSKT
jgi:Fe-S oxidoreductase